MLNSSDNIYEAYISFDALAKLENHVALNKDVEVLGFLIGDFCEWNGKQYTLIVDSQPIESISRSDMVEPHENSLARALNRIDRILKENIIVGWYHSHPDFGCFLSSIDVQTQRSFFSNPNHVALVIDPVRIELKLFKLTDNSYRGIPFIIFKERRKNER
ncbi:Mov34/MPN/PAD-1 family protein [Candidatus Bathyarchaeota archaeon]|nr:Mov34/MPN/PAD-1 family protein [Candidatus Bathyarchaeota archaeon]